MDDKRSGENCEKCEEGVKDEGDGPLFGGECELEESAENPAIAESEDTFYEWIFAVEVNLDLFHL